MIQHCIEQVPFNQDAVIWTHPFLVFPPVFRAVLYTKCLTVSSLEFEGSRHEISIPINGTVVTQRQREIVSGM